MREKLTPVEKLMQYMDACARARGEAQWTNGYRTSWTGLFGVGVEDDRLYQKEKNQWAYCGVVEARFRRYASHLLRKVAKAQSSPRRRRPSDGGTR